MLSNTSPIDLIPKNQAAKSATRGGVCLGCLIKIVNPRWTCGVRHYIIRIHTIFRQQKPVLNDQWSILACDEVFTI